VKVAVTLGREELQFNSVVEIPASLRSFGYRILCLQATVFVRCDDASLDDCCPIFRDSTLVSFSRVAIFILLSLKTKHCVVSTSLAKSTIFASSHPRGMKISIAPLQAGHGAMISAAPLQAGHGAMISAAPLQAGHGAIFNFILRYYFEIF